MTLIRIDVTFALKLFYSTQLYKLLGVPNRNVRVTLAMKN
jgi:hypothetical protein